MIRRIFSEKQIAKYKNKPIYAAQIIINKIEYETIYIELNHSGVIDLKGVMYGKIRGFFGGTETSLRELKKFFSKEGIGFYEELNIDHLICSRETFWEKMILIHYSAVETSSIKPISINIGNKYCLLNKASFWINPNDKIDGFKFKNMEVVLHKTYMFYRCLRKKINNQAINFIIRDNTFGIIISQTCYKENYSAIENLKIYEYKTCDWGFKFSMGSEYSIREYAYNKEILSKPNFVYGIREIFEYVSIIDDDIFKEINCKWLEKTKKMHMCEMLNNNKPDIYFDYEEVLKRRNNLNSFKISSDYYEFHSDIEVMDGFISGIYLTADLHWGKEDSTYSEVEKNVDIFVDYFNSISTQGMLVILGDVFDSKNLSENEILCLHKRMVSNIKMPVYLVIGNKDIQEIDLYNDCGYIKVGYELRLKQFVFTHMPVEIDEYLFNIHGHLHGCGRYINITPSNKYVDVGYKNNGCRVKTLEQYLKDNANSGIRKNENIYEVFDDDAVSLYEKYNFKYHITDVIIDVRTID